jgi:hypothetical protein
MEARNPVRSDPRTPHPNTVGLNAGQMMCLVQEYGVHNPTKLDEFDERLIMGPVRYPNWKFMTVREGRRTTLSAIHFRRQLWQNDWYDYYHELYTTLTSASTLR